MPEVDYWVQSLGCLQVEAGFEDERLAWAVLAAWQAVILV